MEATRIIEDVRLADGTRRITKRDGSVVHIGVNNDVTIHQSDGTTTFLPHNRPRKVPLRERPLNVVSSSADWTGRWMSNFAPAPFELDGQRYASVESFYVCLKYSDDPDIQNEIRGLDAKIAKSIGRKSKATTATCLDEAFELDSPAHHALLECAIRAKLEQDPELSNAFAATCPRPIVHDAGRREKRTAFPAAAFTKILEDLRLELVSRRRPG